MKSGPVDIITVLEVIDFVQYEGKTIYDSFERLLVEQIIYVINKKTLSLGTELLIAAILSRADNFANTFQQKVAKKLTIKSFGHLFTGFEAASRLNQCLVELCVDKGIFANDNHYYVKIQLMIYCQKLHDLQSAVSRPNSKSVIEKLNQKVIQYKFIAEEIPSNFTEKRKSAVNPSSVATKNLRR